MVVRDWQVHRGLGYVHDTYALHDLILGQAAMGIGLHAVRVGLRQIFDEAESQWPVSVLISLKFGDGRLGSGNAVKSYNAGSARPTTWLVLNFGLLDFTDGGEQLDKIFVAGRPRKLQRG
jgi:hypothetical protein